MATRHTPQYLDIELLGEGIAADAHDVDFGGRTRRSSTSQHDDGGSSDADRSHRRPITVTLGAVALIALAAMVTRGTTSPAVIAGSSVTVPMKTVPADTRSPAAEPSPDSTVFGSVSGGSRIIETDDPWQLYFVALGDTYSLDIQTGNLVVVEKAGSAETEVLTVVSTEAGPIVVRANSSDGFVNTVGLAGTLWIREFDGGVKLVDAATGETLRTLDVPWGESASVAGLTSTGDPIVYGPDQRMWSISADDVLTQLPPGKPLALDAGGSVWTRCNDDGVCQSVAESIVGTQAFSTSPWVLYSFSPDGRLLLSGKDDDSTGLVTWTSLDMSTGVTTELEIPLNDSSTLIGPTGWYQGVWTPDGRFFTVSIGRTLAILDTTTMSVSIPSLPSNLGPVRPLAVF
jgi:WD40 repeat protein